jgi:16S rRNA (uracil1498-N3)-methyltransferase
MAASGWCADTDAVAHLLVSNLDDELTVAGADGHHLQRVRRLHPGEVVTAADPTARWRRYQIVDARDGTLTLTAAGAPTLEPTLHPGLRVAVALTKGQRPDVVVRQCSELGVDAVVPVVAARSVVRWDAHTDHRPLERLRRVARESALQCRRARLLAVDVPVPLTSLAGQPGLVVADRLGTPAGVLAEPADGSWLLLVGPEGGLDPAELTTLGDPPRLAVGPHVLRAETAAVAGAAALAGRRHLSPDDHPG